MAVAIDLPVEARVANVGSYCTWASLDTVARANGVQQLSGILEERRRRNMARPDPGYDRTIAAELEARRVHYAICPQGSYDRNLLKRFANTYGVVVSLAAGNPWSIGCHTIVVTQYNDERVEFYDSSRPVDQYRRPRVWYCSRGWFDQWWIGSSVVVFPDDNEPDDESPLERTAAPPPDDSWN
jgi:hypothetical protein